jgi:hypothetical protein
MAGYTHTQEHNDKIRISMTGRSVSEDTRAKISEALTGANNPMLGKRPANTQIVLLTDLEENTPFLRKESLHQ